MVSSILELNVQVAVEFLVFTNAFALVRQLFLILTFPLSRKPLPLPHTFSTTFVLLLLLHPLFSLPSSLQNFTPPEVVDRTKMGVENISMVWAPNFLRCPSDDHTLIFQNARREMSFLRTLLKHLNTDSVAHIK